MEDRVLSCEECDRRFTFTADEQQFYAEKGFQNDPKRCLTCRRARRERYRPDRRPPVGFRHYP